MPYSHYHDGAYHTHRRRRKWGRHYWRHRRGGWRARNPLSTALFCLAVIAGIIWIALSIHERGPAAINGDLPQRVITMFGTLTHGNSPDGSDSTTKAAMLDRTDTESNSGRATRTANATRIADVTNERAQTKAEARRNQHERTIAMLTNIERDKQGLPPLEWDKRLQQIARAHSQDMAKHDYFAHVNRAGEEATGRGRKAGYHCRKVLTARQFAEGLGENIYFGSRGNMEPEDAVESWMNSTGHRENMLDPNYDRIGIGVHEGRHTGYGYGYFTTMVLC